MLISYAQNFEDVILWRALKHVERGFYIDVGAQDPMTDSVSLCFYEAGWRGLHIEASHHYANKLRAARPDEDVIEAAVCNTHGIIPFYELIGTGLSTCDPALAERHVADGFEARRTQVPAITLSDVLQGCGSREIHWLKIDVEGSENAVIDGWLPSTPRPWIVVIESVVPRSDDPSFEDWEPRLLDLGYDFVYFDGLNRFYVTQQRSELARAFGPGPNIFDGFVLSGGNSFSRRLDEEIMHLRQEITHLTEEITHLRQTEHSLLKQSEDFRIEIHKLQQEVAVSARANIEARQQHENARRRHEVEIARLQQEISARERANADTRKRLEARIAELDTVARHGYDAIAHLELEVKNLRASASWRITAPLRWVHSKSIARLSGPPRAAGRDVVDDFQAAAASLAVPTTDSIHRALSPSARLVYEQLKAARQK